MSPLLYLRSKRLSLLAERAVEPLVNSFLNIL
jgi:hypothetical protein